MEIFCNQKEFAELVRSCADTALVARCSYCLFASKCSNSREPADGDFIMSRIEDICEVLPGG